MLLALLRQYVRPYRRLVAAVMTLQLISTLASLYLPTINAAIIDDGVAQGNTTRIVHLGAMMLEDDEEPKDTRMRVEDEERAMEAARAEAEEEARQP